MATAKQALARLDALAQEAREARESMGDSPERKLGQSAKGTARLLREQDAEKYADMIRDLESIGAAFGANLADVVDLTEGNALADRITKLLALDPDDRPAGIDNAQEIVDAWKSAVGRRGGARGDGSHATPPEGFTKCKVQLDFAYPEGAPGEYRSQSVQGKNTGRSTYSSISNEITQAAKEALGIPAGSRPASASKEWLAIAETLKAMDSAPETDTVLGTVTYESDFGPMVATLTALSK